MLSSVYMGWNGPNTTVCCCMRVQYAHVHKDVEEGVRVYVALHVMRRPLEIVLQIELTRTPTVVACSFCITFCNSNK